MTRREVANKWFEEKIDMIEKCAKKYEDSVDDSFGHLSELMLEWTYRYVDKNGTSEWGKRYYDYNFTNIMNLKAFAMSKTERSFDIPVEFLRSSRDSSSSIYEFVAENALDGIEGACDIMRCYETMLKIKAEPRFLEILSLYATGFQTHEIAKHFKISRSRVQQLMVRGRRRMIRILRLTSNDLSGYRIVEGKREYKRRNNPSFLCNMPEKYSAFDHFEPGEFGSFEEIMENLHKKYADA